MSDIQDGAFLPKFRIIILGCSKVGKTNLVMRYINNTFRNDYYPSKDISYINIIQYISKII